MNKEENKNLNLEELVKTNIDNMESPNDLISLIAVSELTNLLKLKVISRIKYEQVPLLSKLYLFAETFNVPFVKNLGDNILQLQISVSGLGRRELVSIVKQNDGTIEPQTKINGKEIFR
jgi:hypothetical protein